MRRALAGLVAIAASACAPALREPPPVSNIAPGSSGARSAAELLRAADAAWARRADPRQAEAAQALYLDAAAADERRVDALLGAMRTMAFRIERDKNASVRTGLAQEEVQLGQWCQRRAPSEPACDYRLALALVLLRAPGWPMGPGDPEAALGEARAAAGLFPESAGNQLVLAEALAKNDSPDAARAAYRKALELATAAAAAGDPDAERWRADASAGVTR